jgi:hypothetical protein
MKKSLASPSFFFILFFCLFSPALSLSFYVSLMFPAGKTREMRKRGRGKKKLRVFKYLLWGNSLFGAWSARSCVFSFFHGVVDAHEL